MAKKSKAEKTTEYERRFFDIEHPECCQCGKEFVLKSLRSQGWKPERCASCAMSNFLLAVKRDEVMPMVVRMPRGETGVMGIVVGEEG